MKIVMNYDLVDKAREAKTGFSLNRVGKKMALASTIALPVLSINNITGTEGTAEFLGDILFCALYYGSYFSLMEKVSANMNMPRAEQELRNLSVKLGDIFVDTDEELLKEVKAYKTTYSINTSDAGFPIVEQKKYITVPVHSDWDNNTRSLVQEHIIGTREYSLAHGEPEKQKVYSFGTKKMIGK